MYRTLTALAVLFAWPAAAEIQCGDYANVTQMAAAQYGEQLLWAATDKDGNRVEVWVSPDGSTWTLFLVPEPGTACPVSYGPVWEFGATPIKGEPA